MVGAVTATGGQRVGLVGWSWREAELKENAVESRAGGARRKRKQRQRRSPTAGSHGGSILNLSFPPRPLNLNCPATGVTRFVCLSCLSLTVLTRLVGR
jgi:hypothetical protein